MNLDIFIVSCAKHVEYLKYSLRSLTKFAAGFHNIVLMFPRNQLDELYFRIPTKELRGVDLKAFDEWPDKGMLHHEYLEMTAPDYCYGADAILHWDSDYVATGPMTPEHYLREGKPVMIYAPYSWLVTQQPNLLNWQKACHAALGYPPENEFMRRPGICHIKEVYPAAMIAVQSHVGKSLDDYIRSCENKFPQTFAEYPLLGEIAWQKYHDRYVWVRQGVDGFVHVPILQFWSHGSMDNQYKLWVNGEEKLVTPRNFCEDLGLGDHQPALSGQH